MAEYIYKTTLYTDTSHVAGASVDNATNLTDFEDNHGDDVVVVEEVVVAQTSFLIDKSYDDFDDLITGDIEWSDVKCKSSHNSHHLYLITNEPL